MSGLEPLAALGLACNILQIVEVGRQTIQLAKVDYDNRSLDPTLEDRTSSIKNISKDIKSVNVPQKWPELQRVVDACFATAGELQDEVDFLLRNAKPGSRLSAMKIAVKANWHKGRLDSLRKKFDDTEKAMQTGLLASLWHHANTSQLDLDTLNSDVRRFVDQYREDHKSTDNTIREEGQNTREHILAASTMVQSQMQLHAGAQASEAQHERLLRSFKYKELNERRNAVKTAFGETFQWIFSEELPPSYRSRYSNPQKSEWHSFGNWLQSTDSMYWISGKPGSGKSTLIKCILTESQTIKHLEMWRPNAVLISHFFWKPGSTAQRNLKGFLCSLVFQLLSKHSDPGLLDNILLSLPGVRFKDTNSDWSIEELDAVCSKFVNAFGQPICLLLDGLDEYVESENDIDGIFDLLDRLLSSGAGDMKICISSRPEPLLQDRLKAYPQLRLQGLTWNDLHLYAESHVKFSPSSPLVNSLVEKAGGVFLWLCLAIKNINKGYMLGDRDPKLIQSRIDSLPDSLSALYQDMWKRASDENPREYRQIAALYFKLVLNRGGKVPWICDGKPDTFDIMMASTSFADRILQVGATEQLLDSVPAGLLLQQYQETERRMAVYCAGLLELEKFDTTVWPYSSWKVTCRHGQEYSQLLKFFSQCKTWRFIHRTAYDFLLDTAEGQTILGSDSTSAFSIPIRIMKSRLAKCRLFEIVHRRLRGPTEDPTSLEYIMPPKENELPNNIQGVERLLLELKSNMEESKDWIQEEFDQLLFSCERLCDAGILQTSRLSKKICDDGSFYEIFARSWDEDKHYRIDRISSSKILSKACGWHDNEEIVQTLLMQGADPNCKVLSPFIPGFVMSLESPFTACLQRMLVANGDGWTRHVRTPRHIQLTMVTRLRATMELISHGANLGEALALVFDIDDRHGPGLRLSPLSCLNPGLVRKWRRPEGSRCFGIAVLPAYTALKIILQTGRDRIHRMDTDDEDESRRLWASSSSSWIDVLSKIEDEVCAHDDDEDAHNLLLCNPPLKFSDQRTPSNFDAWSGEYSEVPAQKSPKRLMRQLLVGGRWFIGPEAFSLYDSFSKKAVKGEGHLLQRLQKLGLIMEPRKKSGSIC